MAVARNVLPIGVDVVRAWPRRHEQVHLTLPEGATVEDALKGSGWSLLDVAGVAIFGERVERGRLLLDTPCSGGLPPAVRKAA